MKLHARLQRRERVLVDAGCPACRHRRRLVTRTATLSDGTLVWDSDEPQSCPRCGQISEPIIEIVETVVDERTAQRRRHGQHRDQRQYHHHVAG
jgi:hypothetical protein